MEEIKRSLKEKDQKLLAKISLNNQPGLTEIFGMRFIRVREEIHGEIRSKYRITELSGKKGERRKRTNPDEGKGPLRVPSRPAFNPSVRRTRLIGNQEFSKVTSLR